MYCFFCCKVLPKEETCQNDNNDENFSNYNHLNTKISDNDHINQSKVNGEENQENILLISRYLKLPRNEINEAQELGTFSTVRFCQDCDNISEKLGELCGLLEKTQMEVKYYLNLLTNKIVQKEERIDQKNVSFSSFQQNFHEKCLTKFAEIGPNPVVQLEKWKVPPVEVVKKEEITEESEDHNDITVEQYPQIPVILIPQPSSSSSSLGLKYSCDFCPLTFQNLTVKQCHIEVSHNQKKTSSGHLIKSCEFCGAMISSRNMSSHKKRVHGKGRNVGSRMAGNGIFHSSSEDKSTSSLSLDVPKRRPQFNHNKYSKCEYCGQIYHCHALTRHIKLVHLKKLVRRKLCDYCGVWVEYSASARKVHMLEFHSLQITDEGFRCMVCNSFYTLRQSWKRHLIKSEKCKGAVFGEKGLTERMAVVEEEMGIDEETISLPSPSPPEIDEDEVLVENDEKMSTEKDPLSIVFEIL